jgi:hypothetical protein
MHMSLRDSNGNQFAGATPLKDAHGRPIVPVIPTPAEKSTIEVLEASKRALDEVTQHLTGLMAANEALAKAYTDLKVKQAVAPETAVSEAKPAKNGKKKAESETVPA